MAPKSTPPSPRFADGTIQPIEAAKFTYNRAAGVFTRGHLGWHSSADVAAQPGPLLRDQVGRAWRMLMP
jgi:hypothetical protein